MLFNSVEFMFFLPVVVLIYFIIPNKIKHLWLLFTSYFFYMCWNAKYALLILTSTVVTFVGGLLIEKIKSTRYDENKKTALKKWVVAASFLINLGILFFFKYFGFVLNGLWYIVSRFQWVKMPKFDVLLPVGISFYTFQALSYIMDVYRDDIYAEKNFFRYALFVSFFPQLVAGPIERSKNLLRQLAVPKKFNYEQAREGVLLMLWGFFLKIVIADRLSIFVDTVYSDYTTYAGAYLIVATILFAFQIYCDFYGYSTIAMGTAKILGIQLMENFDTPYLALSVSEFWRRWHISLSSWFKDYLYFPLGGSRKGTLRKHLNKMIVFLVSGLWHGASISFVAWGGLNGLYQILGELLKPLRDKLVSVLQLNRKSLAHKLLQVITTFVLIDFSWIFFRAPSFRSAFQIIHEMIAVKNPWILFDGSLYNCGLDAANFWLAIACIVILLFADVCKRRKIVIRKVIIEQDYWFRWIFIAAVVCAILLFGKWGPSFDKAAFIYFQF